MVCNTQFHCVIRRFLGEPNAELSLAHCYSHGKGVSEDLSKAFEYHISAAEKGV